MSDIDLDSLLDGNLAEIEDLPDFVTPPTGFYGLSVPECKLETYTKKGKDGAPDVPNQVRIRLAYKIEEVGELENAGSVVPVAAGSLFSDTYMYDEKGLAIFKRQAKNILNVESVDNLALRDLFAELQAAEPFMASVKTSKNAAGYENTKVSPIHAE